MLKGRLVMGLKTILTRMMAAVKGTAAATDDLAEALKAPSFLHIGRPKLSPKEKARRRKARKQAKRSERRNRGR